MSQSCQLGYVGNGNGPTDRQCNLQSYLGTAKKTFAKEGFDSFLAFFYCRYSKEQVSSGEKSLVRSQLNKISFFKWETFSRQGTNLSIINNNKKPLNKKNQTYKFFMVRSQLNKISFSSGKAFRNQEKFLNIKIKNKK